MISVFRDSKACVFHVRKISKFLFLNQTKKLENALFSGIRGVLGGTGGQAIGSARLAVTGLVPVPVSRRIGIVAT